MSTRVFNCKFFPSQHDLIKDHTLNNFLEKIPTNMSFLNFEMGKLLDCGANFNILIDTALILHYIVAARFKRKSDHTLIQDHTFIDFAKIVHPPCLFRTTPLFGPLE